MAVDAHGRSWRIAASRGGAGTPSPTPPNTWRTSAGHAVGIGRPYAPTAFVVRARPHPATGRLTVPGGTAEGSALAREDAWRRVLVFLETNFRGAR